MERHACPRVFYAETPDCTRQQARGERRLTRDLQRPRPQFPDLTCGGAQVVEPGIGPLDLAGERLALDGRRRAAVSANEQRKAKFGLKLRNRPAHVRLTNAERGRGLGHSAMP